MIQEDPDVLIMLARFGRPASGKYTTLDYMDSHGKIWASYMPSAFPTVQEVADVTSLSWERDLDRLSGLVEPVEPMLTLYFRQ